MRRISLLSAAMVLGVALFWALSPDALPSYQGRTLSEWLDEVGVKQAVESKADLQAREAIAAMSTNAVPYLVGCIGYSAPGWKKTALGVANAILTPLPSSFRLQDNRERRAEQATIAIQEIRDVSHHQVAELVVLGNSANRNTSHRALRALSSLARHSLAPQLALARHSDPGLRTAAIASLRKWHTNKVCALQAVPVLIASLNDEHMNVARHAAFTLGRLEVDLDRVLPALNKALEDPRPEVRREAAYALIEIGNGNAPATPALLAVLTDRDLRAATYRPLRNSYPR